MKHFAYFFGTCTGELELELFSKNQLLRYIENNPWLYRDEKKEKIQLFIEDSVPGDMFGDDLVCVNLREDQKLDILHGDTVQCLVTCEFADGTSHQVGDLIKVDYKNIDYLVANRNRYEVVDE